MGLVAALRSFLRMCESICLCFMHHAVRVFGRRVNSEHLHGFIASVSEIMFRSSWHSKHVSGPNIMSLLSDESLSRAFYKNQNLIHMFMDFPADIFTRRNAHQDHLRMFVCEQHFSEVIVLQSRLVDILVLHKGSVASIYNASVLLLNTCKMNLSKRYTLPEHSRSTPPVFSV